MQNRGQTPHQSRREFIISSILGLSGAELLLAVASHDQPGRIQSVRGPISPSDLGMCLMHEHVLVDFIGADQIRKDRYSRDEVSRIVTPHLRRRRQAGCRTLVECTPAYIGRDPLLLRQLSKAAGIQILTNTGYYGAANQKYLPSHAFTEDANQMAKRWTDECRHGIENTGIKPAFIKIGVNAGPLSKIDSKLVRAAARAHRATGLTIASHTGNGRAALDQLAILKDEGVSPAALIWVHAQNEKDSGIHFDAARQGAWVEYDGIRASSLERDISYVREFFNQRLSHRLLLSQDAGWYHVGELNGGSFQSYEYLVTVFVKELLSRGTTQEQVRTLLIENPRSALIPKKRISGA
jgi:predicted metal-dependent phosphotriesterase family hydrolase